MDELVGAESELSLADKLLVDIFAAANVNFAGGCVQHDFPVTADEILCFFLSDHDLPPPLFWKLFSNGCYLVPFLESSLGMLGVIANSVRRLAPPVAVVASRSVLGFFGRCVLPRGGCYWNSRGDASSGEPRRKWFSPACN